MKHLIILLFLLPSLVLAGEQTLREKVNIGDTTTYIKKDGSDLKLKDASLSTERALSELLTATESNTYTAPQIFQNSIDVSPTVVLNEVTDPPTPTSGKIYLYVDESDGKLKKKTSSVTLDLEADNFSGSWDDLTDKPSTFPPETPIPWADVSKTGSDLSDLETRDYSSLTGTPTIISLDDPNTWTAKQTFGATENNSITLVGDTEPPTPTSGKAVLYLDVADGVLKKKDDTSITDLESGSGFSGSWNDLTDKPTIISLDDPNTWNAKQTFGATVNDSITFVESVEPEAPATGTAILFLDEADGKLKKKDNSSLVDLEATGGGSGSASDSFSVYKSSNQALTVSPAIITWDSEDHDDGGNFDLANDVYTAPSTGYYLFNLELHITNQQEIYIYQNGGEVRQLRYAYSVNDQLSGSFIIPLTAGDTIEIYGKYVVSGASVGGASYPNTCRFSGCKLY